MGLQSRVLDINILEVIQLLMITRSFLGLQGAGSGRTDHCKREAGNTKRSQAVEEVGWH